MGFNDLVNFVVYDNPISKSVTSFVLVSIDLEPETSCDSKVSIAEQKKPSAASQCDDYNGKNALVETS